MIKNLSLWRMMMLLIVAIISSMSISSCSKDDDDAPSNSSSNSIVGTWYYWYNGDIDNEDRVTFSSNGTFSWYDYGSWDRGTYEYDPKQGVLTLFGEGYVDVLDVEFFSSNKIYIETAGTYVRK